jgi:hypothetical protein
MTPECSQKSEESIKQKTIPLFVKNFFQLRRIYFHQINK